MKKSKRPRQAEPATFQATPQPSPKKFVWWPWVAALAGLFLAFEIYGPALYGPFVLDDLCFPFKNAYAAPGAAVLALGYRSSPGPDGQLLAESLLAE